MRKLAIIVAASILGLTSAQAKKPACFPINWDDGGPYERLNPAGDESVMLGPCVPSAVVPDGPEDESAPGNWWLAFSCGYAAYRDGKATQVNPYHKNAGLKEAWGKGWDKAKLDCTKGGWWDEDGKAVIKIN